jgi:ATP-binding cassette, subfamily B, bacterial
LQFDKEQSLTVFDLKSSLADNRLVGFWRMMKGYRLHYVGATLCVGLSAILNTGKFLLIRYFVDDVLKSGVARFTEVSLAIALGFIALALVQGLFTFLSGKLAAQTSEGLALRLRDYLFDHIQRLSFTYHDKMQTGELIQRCTSDIDAIRRFFAEQAIGVGRIILLFAINFIALLTLHWQLALLSVMVVPLIALLSYFFFQRVSKAYDAFQNQEARLSTALQENLSGVRVVKAFSRQVYEQNKFETENAEKLRLGEKLLVMHAAYWPSSDILTGFQLLLGLFVGARLAIDGDITVGTYLAYAGMIIWIIYPMRELGRLLVQMSTGLVSYGRLVELIREEREYLGKEETPPLADIQGSVVFEHVSFGYEKDKHVLRDISFAVQAGQTVALLGSTGSGKTTLLGLLPRFYDYTDGSIKVDGIELHKYPRYFLRQNIGIVEQEPFLFSRSIRENIAYGAGREVSDLEVEEAAQAAALHETILSFPEGYNTLIGEKGVTLSGGQKQRVALARTLLKNPRILILDDATSAVDTETESEIRGALNRLMENRTSFIIAHRIQSVMLADLILVMDKGHIVQRGHHEDLMAQDGIYRRTYDMQAQIELELEREIARVGL